MLAADALQGLAAPKLAMLVVAAAGAAKALRPVRLEQRSDASFVRSVAVEKVPKDLSRLELDTVLRNRQLVLDQMLSVHQELFRVNRFARRMDRSCLLDVAVTSGQSRNGKSLLKR